MVNNKYKSQTQFWKNTIVFFSYTIKLEFMAVSNFLYLSIGEFIY